MTERVLRGEQLVDAISKQINIPRELGRYSFRTELTGSLYGSFKSGVKAIIRYAVENGTTDVEALRRFAYLKFVLIRHDQVDDVVNQIIKAMGKSV